MGISALATGQAEDSSRVYRGLRVQYDIGRNLLSAMEKGRTDYEIMVDFGLSPKYYLVAEAGKTALSRQADNYSYQLSGIYFRVGYDKSLNTIGKDLICIGLRYGASFFDHSASNIILETDSIWGNSIPAKDLAPTSNQLHWLEAVVSLKVEIFKKFYLGWSLRGRLSVYGRKNFSLEPYRVPGFGSGSRKASAGFNYYIGYRLPF
ncbi:MAG: hypothetical protein HC896_06200 [Bacteroidales bacterium]|nr:hypothetical protein [Bacteroidales bacterium]